jgi:hypothetical protein
MKATILQFKGVHHYCDYWDNQSRLAIADGGSYGNYISNREGVVDRNLIRGETEDNIIAYGDPLPANYKEAMDRKYFMNMNLYNNAFQELEPFLSRLEKVSQGIIPREVIKPTDREIGIFSFERAMMLMEGTPALYSSKTKKYYAIGDGERILEKNGTHKKNKDGKLLFKLKKEGIEVFLTQLIKDGKKQFISKNKKSFLTKEKHPRPFRTLRIFVLIGQNWGENTYWAGVTAVICALFLEGVGYAVQITGVIGVRNDGLNFGGSGMEEGHRFSIINVKDYTETMDSLSLLYILADPSFFRIRQFGYFVAQQYKYRDTFDEGLGWMPSISSFSEALSEEIKSRNIEQEKDTLYYFLGGQEIHGIEDSKNELIRIICQAENTNKEILIKLGYEFPTNEQSPLIEYADFDCANHI